MNKRTLDVLGNILIMTLTVCIRRLVAVHGLGSSPPASRTQTRSSSRYAPHTGIAVRITA